jgi:signal transduction histidine kinase
MRTGKMSRNFRFAVCALLLTVTILLSIQPAFAAGSAKNTGGRTVRIGITDAENEQNRNFQEAYFKALAQYAGWDCKFVSQSWDECLSSLKSGEIDFLSDVSITEERSAYMDFSAQPMGTELCYMYGPNDTALAYDDFQAFNGIRVGYEEGSTLLDSFRAFADSSGFSFTPVPYKTDPEATAAMNAGEVDAVIQTSFLLTPSKSKVLAKCGPGLVYIAASKAKPGLKTELDDAMMQLLSLYPNFNADIHNYYLGANSEQTVGYTAEEKAYLASKPVVTVYYEANWEPFEYEENGEARGITPDLLRAVGEETGINFKLETTPSTKDQYVSVGSASGDTVMAVSYDYLWADDHGLLMTQPYVAGSVMRVSRTGSTSPGTAAVVKDTYLESRVSACYPELKQVEYLTTGECMDAVASGSADCAFINSYQATDYRAKSAYSGLSYQPVGGLTQGIALGVTANSDPRLLSILSKALYSIYDNSLPDILSRDSVRAEPVTFSFLLRRYPVQSAAVLAAVCAAAAVIIFLLVTSAQRKKQNLQLAAAKQESELARQAADKANAAKSDFLSRMSHDIRTPINGIIGMTYLMKEMELPEPAQEDLNKIDTSSKFLLNLINDVLDMAKAESGKIELHPEPYGADEFLGYLDSVVMPLCKDKNIHFVIDAEPVAGVLPLMDKLRINQVFFNLLSNAVKFTPEGGTVTYKLREHLTDDCRLALEGEVSDTGVGMSEEFQKRLFEPFSQEMRSDSSETRGTGLGLSIVKKLLNLMNCKIEVHSEPGKGTAFNIRGEFDCVREKAADADAPVPAVQNTADLAGMHILLCEDHPLNQEIAKALLSGKGALVSVAEDGRQGVETFVNSAPGFYRAVLMDVRMPVMDGLTAARQIRSLERPDAKTVPIIAMTADAFAEDIQKCLDAGMDGHIAKPIDPQRLFQVLVDAICRQATASHDKAAK